MAETPSAFLSQAKTIVLRHKDLQLQVSEMQEVITQLENEGHKLVSGKQTTHEMLHRGSKQFKCV